MAKYSKNDIIRIVDEEDIEVYPFTVYGYFRRVKKYCNYVQPA